MRSLVLILFSIVALVLVSNVVAEEEMTNEEMKALLKAYEKMADQVTKAVSEMEEEEAKIFGNVEERDVDSPLGK